MDEIDEILGTNDKYNKKYENNKWEKQNADRKEAYNTIENMTQIIKKDEMMFKKYLDIQSRFDKYSVGNCLIILKKQPNAMQIKDEKSWKDKGIDIIPNPTVIKILEPNKSNETQKVYFNPKEVYDISQTNAQKNDIEVNYDNKELLKAFFHKCIAKIKTIDFLSNGEKGAEYNEKENTLYVCRGMDNKLVFQVISQELANIEMRKEEVTEYRDFKSYCISYMICKKYGIDVSNYNFSDLPDKIKDESDGRNIRSKLEEIRITYETINSTIAEYFKISEKEKQKKNENQERW